MRQRGRFGPWTALAAMLLMAGASPLAAAEEAPPAPASAPQAAEAAKAVPEKVMEATGRIVEADHLNERITLERSDVSGMELMRFFVAFDDETEITKADVRLTPADLRVSEETVTIRYTLRNDQPLASAIAFMPPSGLKEVMGTIHGINLVDGTLTVKTQPLIGKEEPVSIRADEGTLVALDGQRSYLALLSTADRVTVRYADGGGRLVAYTIMAHRPEAVAEPKRFRWPWERRPSEGQRASGVSTQAPVAR